MLVYQLIKSGGGYKCLGTVMLDNMDHTMISVDIQDNVEVYYVNFKLFKDTVESSGNKGALEKKVIEAIYDYIKKEVLNKYINKL